MAVRVSERDPVADGALGDALEAEVDRELEPFRGLRHLHNARGPDRPTLRVDNDAGLLVRPGAARRQIEAETQAQPPDERPSERGGEQPGKSGRAATSVAPPAAPKFKRFHGAVVLDPERVGRDASRIADEVVSHLKGLDGAKVKVTLEIEAEMLEGAPDNVVRNVNENSRTLKFVSYEFEAE